MNRGHIVREIQNCDVVSFDIFDTLIYRPFVNPTDVFLFLEKKHNKQGFKQNRVEAEQKARLSIKQEEVTLDEIYSYIASEYKVMQKAEIDFEIDNSQEHTINTYYYRKACAQNKTIVITSDIYLPEAVIEDILEKHHIKYDLLLLSSTEKKTKSSGTLFKKLKAIYSVEKILHLGDNKHSDCDKANSSGLTGIHLPKISEQYLKNDQRHARLFSKLNESDDGYLAHSAMIMLCAAGCVLNNVKNSIFWQWFGYIFAGPMLIGFSQYIHRKVMLHQVKNLIFIARDGYFLKHVYESLYGTENINTKYVYAQRKVISQLTIENKEFDFIKSLNLNTLENSMMVDVGTCNFTSQHFLKDWFPKLRGVYWVTGGANNSNLSFDQCYDWSNRSDSRVMNSGLIEFFMTSTESPVIGVDSYNAFTPKYASTVAAEEQLRINALYQIEQGIYQFVDQCKKTNLGDHCYLNPSSVIELNNLWLMNPTVNEIKNLSKIKHASASDHEQYLPMFKFSRKSMNYWLSKVL